MFLLAWLLACHPSGPDPERAAPPRPAQVRFRPGEPADEAGRTLVAAVPGSGWDLGLVQACEELLAGATSRRAWLDAESTSLALARAGYPGQARFARVLNGGAFPDELAAQAAGETAVAPGVDVALVRRTYADGAVLWIGAWAARWADLDPLPRDLALDDTVAVTVGLADEVDTRLFVATPDGPVEEMAITPGVNRWVDRFHTPGEYRLEVVTGREGRGRVALLFSLFVETVPPPPRRLFELSSEPPDPVEAEAVLYERLDLLRGAHGLRPVARFPLFEALAREHSALMAAEGLLAHALPGATEGVAARAAATAHPRAQHFEDVAAAHSVDEALALVTGSPGHLRNLLCERCTHAAIGVALEPVVDRPPRLFVTWELLAFPQGAPRPIDHYNR